PYQGQPGQYQGQAPVFNPDDIKQNKIVAALSYLGIFVLVPLLGRANSPFSRWHSNQGLMLLIVNVIVFVIFAGLAAIFGSGILSTLFTIILALLQLGIAYFVFVNLFACLNGQIKELPLIGHIRLVK
ncbi:MAG: hypothetical protein LBU69_02985, partial [Deltaproteobacteria bacterium]|nr:hypothetical protein [Deltaproteobacteria bacterium]